LQKTIYRGFQNSGKVLFANRGKYNVFGSDEHNYVWREPGEELCSKVKHVGCSVTSWGCVAASGVGNLHLIEGITNKHIYVNILREHLKASAEKLGIVP
jgi:hypothetical protein